MVPLRFWDSPFKEIHYKVGGIGYNSCPMSQFAFLNPEWPDVHDAAGKAESLAYPDPRTACFYARRALELALHWLYKHDPALKLPYREHLSALIQDQGFRGKL